MRRGCCWGDVILCFCLDGVPCKQKLILIHRRFFPLCDSAASIIYLLAVTLGCFILLQVLSGVIAMSIRKKTAPKENVLP